MKNIYKKTKKNRELASADDKALVGATNSVITEGDRVFLKILNRDYHFEIGNIGDYVFSVVSPFNGGIVDVFFANDLIYVDLPQTAMDRIFVKFDGKIFEKLAFGNRENGEVLVAIFEYKETIGRLEFLTDKDMVVKVFWDGYVLKKIGNILVLHRESE